MLQNHLTKVKGKLLEMLFEMYRDMNTYEDKIDYDSLYTEFQSAVNDLRNVKDLSGLEAFCESFGLNDDITNVFSFPALVAEAYKD